MVLIDAEDDFVTNTKHLVVVGTEHLVVVGRRLELVAQVDDLLAVLSTLCIVGIASIDLCVQIELSQNHVDQTLASTILLRIGGQPISTLLHVLDHPIEKVGTADLLGVGTTDF